jgi:pimeloyl-ACP methyl ester carboxylesterase
MPEEIHRIPGLILIDHTFEVPLDPAMPRGETIHAFARELVAANHAADTLPYLLFLQGGPGFPAPRPLRASGWLKRALQDFRVLLLDQRGTGRSTPATAQTLARFPDPVKQAEYLTHFRADGIVADAEWIRKTLLGEGRRWTILGQSYGGFCALHYLCEAPEGLDGALFTGGLPPIDASADDVYRATYERVLERNARYYERYPDDEALAGRIVEALNKGDIRLPSGDRLSPQRFQQLGFGFGMSDGFERVHYLLEEAFAPTVKGEGISTGFLHGFDRTFAFETNPIYAILHEAIYAQGEATQWAAQRVRAEYPQFEPQETERVCFTGEMIYPWMFEEIHELRPLRKAAEILAQREDWPHLYDRETLSRNDVPCAAAVYHDDMYVDRRFSLETAQAVRGLRPWITNEYEHNGLRVDGERVLGRLLDLLRGVAQSDRPSRTPLSD